MPLLIISLIVLAGFLTATHGIPPPVLDGNSSSLSLLHLPNVLMVKRASLKTKWVMHNGQVTDANYGNSIRVDATSSVSDNAHRVAAIIVAHMTTHLSDANFAKAAVNTKIGVFTQAETLAVYPEYSQYATYGCSERQCTGSCQRSCTFDGRQYYTLAGVGGARAVIRDANLLCHDDYRGKSNILVHEYAHSIHGNVLDSAMKSRITAAFANARNTGIWSDHYAMSNEQEYFAVGTSVFFHTEETTGAGTHSMNSCNNQVCWSEAATRYHLYQRDILLYGILYDIFSDKPGNLAACMAY